MIRKLLTIPTHTTNIALFSEVPSIGVFEICTGVGALCRGEILLCLFKVNADFLLWDIGKARHWSSVSDAFQTNDKLN